MNRWQEQLANHQIHETLKEARAFAETSHEKLNPEVEIEKRRLLKILDQALEPDPKVVEQYQHVMIQSVFAKRWSEQWHGLVLPGMSIAEKGYDIQVT